MSTDGASYTRWTPAEYLKVAVNALPLIDEKGKNAEDAYYSAQRVLPKERRREREDIHRATWNKTLDNYIAKARALSKAARDELYVPPPERKMPPPRKSLDEGRNYTGNVRWTDREKALITRQVLHWQSNGDARSLARLVIEAQELVIPADRRRSVAGLYQANSNSAKKGTTLKDLIEEGKSRLWLIENIPFNEGLTSAVTEGAEEPVSALVEPESPPAATTPLAPRSDALAEAARAFGEHMQQGLDRLLRTHHEVVLSAVLSKIDAMSATVATSIAGMIEQGLRSTVHKIVEAELGGPVAAPPAPATAPAPAPTPAPAVGGSVAFEFAESKPDQEPDEPERKKLKVDIVGFSEAAATQQVRAALNGGADLRFFSPDEINRFSPHRGRHCIMMTHRVPHAIKHKIKASGVEPIYVRPTVGHVLHAIEELQRAAGLLQ